MEKKEVSRKEVITSAVVLIILCTFYGVLLITIPPFNRGFFCDDRSIQKPYVSNQLVPNTIALITGVFLVFFTILILETYNFFRVPKNYNRPLDTTSVDIFGCFSISAWIERLIVRVFAFGFGAVSNATITEIAKLMIGRLRPHFLAACKPDYSRFNCSEGFITVDVCTGSLKIITEARKSFPSGHSSFAAFTMVFLALYIQHVWVSRRNGFLKSLVQLIAILLGLACGFSRISDYFHHWSDVLAGFALGTIYAFYTIYIFMNLPKKEKLVRSQRMAYQEADIESGQSSTSNGNELGNCVNHKKNEVFTDQEQ